MPDAGVPDADTGPPCECMPGETDEVMVPCGGCDEGTRTDTRTCGTDCQWGDFAPGPCMGAGCMPEETTACANGDPCGERVCGADCTYGPCEPSSGAECLRIRPGGTIVGSNYRCCGTYMWEYCLAGCVWSGMCESCDPMIGCPDCP
ncbi:MAG: hypothetical protein GWN73_43440 [Actinobacteria bacterium]|nr:hypothetical protein [Actinomycetota bacterium]NIU71859.1 hypothetical protein [Actinomycetota bacterium]NIW33805.1 hypothetical protein [Actinomycetota bacterium]